ncbi:hypothetical protein LCM08_00530 [Salipiger pacificus]|nr:hypothetical protein [Alloyangia pacifica]
MKKKVLSLAAAIALGAATPAISQQISGNSLYQACKGDDVALATFCVGYTTGVVEGESFGALVILGQLFPEQNTAEANERINMFMRHCIPSNATNEQVRDVVIAYLEAHPETRHYPARGLIWNAMMEGFPCT